MSPVQKRDLPEIRYVELYAGIGGWRQALESLQEKLVLPLKCIGALDHSDVCRTVYQYNWPFDEFETRPIESVVTEAKWKDWDADIVVLSPPCQPHTRQHDNQNADLDDPRSRSFLHICQLLKKEVHLPTVLILENVVGFESSKSYQSWLEAILPQYHVAQFHLDPTQVGISNERPRYYCVAVLGINFRPRKRRGHNGSDDTRDNSDWVSRYFSLAETNTEAMREDSSLHTSIPELYVQPTSAPETLPKISQILDDIKNPELEQLRLTKQKLGKPSSWCLDVVGKDSRRSSCFTSSYGKFFKGTGSVLAYKTGNGPDVTISLQSPEDRSFNSDWFKDLLDHGYEIRYFSGEELLRLFGFHRDFKFPLEITTKQKWKLVGNSLNIRVASKVVELGLLASGLVTSNQLDNSGTRLEWDHL